MIAKTLKRILLVEDNSGDARLLREMLKDQQTVEIELTHVEKLCELETHVQANAVDVILLDLGLPDAQGLEAVRRTRLAAPRVALIVITGLDDETMAVQALQDGAQDYLAKGNIDTCGLMRALRNAFERNVMETAALAMARQMAHSAEHDFLTGLPNRMLLNDRIGQSIALASRHSNKVAVLFLDLDGFKHINDSLGHPAGDKLLQSISSRLIECVRASDTVSRQGGDEFVVLLSEVDQAEDVMITARRILRAVAGAHSINEQELHITTSIGISVYPDDGMDAEALIKNADTAMYQAKANERQGFQFFTSAMNIRAVERQALEESLRRALEREELELHYQPRVDLNTGAIVGAEALLRWTHPTRGAIPPAVFIPIAEECGLILQIGRWVMRTACLQAQAWVDAGLLPLLMAVNVSALEFRDERFLSNLLDILQETGFDAKFLEVELTESVLMKRAESAALLLNTVRARGVRVAIDDFGTGYSSLSYLRKFPVDALKIDQSFVRQIGPVADDASLVTAVIAMARSLKLRVVAEGVETEEQRAFLRGQKCDEAQGYYFSKPVPAHQFARLMGSVADYGETAGRSVATT
jgi:diguanylate cyclase (GGDEF)-like protein